MDKDTSYTLKTKEPEYGDGVELIILADGEKKDVISVNVHKTLGTLHVKSERGYFVIRFDACDKMIIDVEIPNYNKG